MIAKAQFVITTIITFMFAGSVSAAEWGDLTGKFVYKGTAPTPAKINVDKDKEEFGNLGLVNESLIVGKDGGIANVVVYLRSKNQPIHPDYEKDLVKELTYDNKGGKFVPRVLTLWCTKQTVHLHNSDGVAHNSNVQPIGDPDAATNPLLPAGTGISHKFNKSQVSPVPIGCNIHPWMTGYILPRDNPYSAVTAEDGTFTIKNLPVGDLEFQVWHEPKYLATPKWENGRFTMKIKPGKNDLGKIEIDPKLLGPKK